MPTKPPLEQLTTGNRNCNVSDCPQIAELDIKPLLADTKGVCALDARVRVRQFSGQKTDRLAIWPYPRELEQTMLLSDGRAVLVRPVQPGDGPAVVALFGRMAPEDIRLRFFVAMRTVPAGIATRLTQIDYLCRDPARRRRSPGDRAPDLRPGPREGRICGDGSKRPEGPGSKPSARTGPRRAGSGSTRTATFAPPSLTALATPRRRPYWIFRLTGVQRFGLVTPYLEEIQQKILTHFRTEGFDCVAERHLFYDSVATAIWSSLRLAKASPRQIQGWGRLLRDIA